MWKQTTPPARHRVMVVPVVGGRLLPARHGRGSRQTHCWGSEESDPPGKGHPGSTRGGPPVVLFNRDGPPAVPVEQGVARCRGVWGFRTNEHDPAASVCPCGGGFGV